MLQHAAPGKTSAAIGISLHISETTVKTYLSRAFDKLGVSDAPRPCAGLSSSA